jgi:hypothetical protein
VKDAGGKRGAYVLSYSLWIGSTCRKPIRMEEMKRFGGLLCGRQGSSIQRVQRKAKAYPSKLRST